MKDVTSRQDLELLMKEFYLKLFDDNQIGYIFTEIANIDLQQHLPKIVDFWEQNIFQTGTYKNNVMQLHLYLDDLTPLSREHFKRWLSHFEETINKNFIGQNAERMKTNALSIATVMQIKLQNKHQ